MTALAEFGPGDVVTEDGAGFVRKAFGWLL